MDDAMIKNLFRLVDTWDETNLEMVIKITQSGGAELRAAFMERYGKMIEGMGKKRIDSFRKLPTKWKKMKNIHRAGLLNNWNPDVPFLNQDEEFYFSATLHTERYFNQLDEVPEGIKVMKNLKKFSFHFHHIEHLTDAIGELTALTKISLLDNKLKALPLSFKKLKNLETLILSMNSFEFIPEVLFEMEHLKLLHIYKNPLINKKEQISHFKQRLPQCRVVDRW